MLLIMRRMHSVHVRTGIHMGDPAGGGTYHNDISLADTALIEICSILFQRGHAWKFNEQLIDPNFQLSRIQDC